MPHRRNGPPARRLSSERAVDLARAGGAHLAITHGLPGSGKSYVSQDVVEAGDAIRVRSDVERKRLFGLGGLQSSRAQVPLVGRQAREGDASEADVAVLERLRAVDEPPARTRARGNDRGRR